MKFLRDILTEVSKKNGINIGDLTGKERARRYSRPRQEFCYLAAVETDKSLHKIGKTINRQHTTILHGVRMHAARNGLSLPRNMKGNGRYEKAKRN